MNNLPNNLFDPDLLSFDDAVSQTIMHQPQQQPQASSSRRKRSSTASSSGNVNGASSGMQRGKQIRMDAPSQQPIQQQNQQHSRNIEVEVEDGFQELFSDVGAKETISTSTMSRKLNGGVITVTAPAFAGSTHLVKIEIYDLKEIEGKACNEIWRHSIVRSKVLLNKKENAQVFDTINSITLDLAKQMKNTEGSESKFVKN